MKDKVLKVKYIVFFIIILIPVSFISYVVYANYTVEHNEELSLNYIKQLVEYPEGSYNTNNTKEVIRRLSCVNPKIFKKMVEKDIKIRFINSKLTDNEEIMTLINAMTTIKGIPIKDIEGLYLYDYFSEKFLVAIRIDVMVNGADGVEVHEIAHAADNMMGNVSLKEEFLEIYKEEKNNIFPGEEYAEYLDSEEYFAEIFKYYYEGEMVKKKLKGKVPKSYEFIKRFIHDFN